MKNSKTFIVIVPVAAAIIIVASVLLASILNTNTNGTGRHNKYTLSLIERKLDEELDTQKVENYILARCHNLSSEYRDLDFYLLSSERKANKFYDDYLENNLYNVENFDEYSTGWLNGVCDASVKVCVMKFNNLVVVCKLEVWGDYCEDALEDEYEPICNVHHDQDFIDQFIEEWSL